MKLNFYRCEEHAKKTSTQKIVYSNDNNSRHGKSRRREKNIEAIKIMRNMIEIISWQNELGVIEIGQRDAAKR